VVFTRGSGCILYDADGKEYIDFASGIGVNSIGHAHPKWVEAIAGQAGTLAHTSNLYYTEPGVKLAERLCRLSGLKAAFFANSGAEANEGLIKTARKYSRDKYGDNRATILTLTGSFHGRTVTTLAATGQESFHHHFHPFTQGFRHVPADDLAALEAEGGDVCALLIEPVLGEGGVIPLDAEYVKQAAALCRERDWLLLMDEIQTGIGRTGHWFGFQGLNTPPDALSFAKGIAGGIPFGGFLVNDKLKAVLRPGDHGTTYGGNLVGASAALAVLDILEPELPVIKEKGEYIRTKIESMNLPNVTGTRGKGLMIGVKIEGAPPRDINAKLLEAGLVGLTAGTDAIRFLPPLVIGYKDIDKGLALFERVLKS
jgi:acetylornithine/N-succinyldiaminopimelate aminotransferase